MSTLTDQQLLTRLVGFETTSARPSRVVSNFVANYLKDAGCEVFDYPYSKGEKHNIIARMGPAEADGILLCGHLDTVPAGEANWNSDPHQMLETGEWFVGRGTADMKGFIALAMNLFGRLDSDKLTKQVALLLTSDEEVGSIGAQQFVDDWDNRFPLPSEVIVGEPTQLRVVRMHKGHLKLRITTTGHPAHSGYPHLGINAIEPAADVIATLRDLRRTLEKEGSAESNHFPDCPYPVLNVAMISGGRSVNIVPDRCVIDVGVRLLPGQLSADFLARCRSVLGDVRLEIVNDSPSMCSGEDVPLHRDLCKLVGQTESLGVSFSSDAGALQRLGLSCVLWGPGNIENAHRANEYIAIEEFRRGGELLEQFVRSRCGG